MVVLCFTVAWSLLHMCNLTRMRRKRDVSLLGKFHIKKHNSKCYRIKKIFALHCSLFYRWLCDDKRYTWPHAHTHKKMERIDKLIYWRRKGVNHLYLATVKKPAYTHSFLCKSGNRKQLHNRRRHSHLGFEVLGGVTWGIINDLVNVRHIPGQDEQKDMKQSLYIQYPNVKAGQCEKCHFVKKYSRDRVKFNIVCPHRKWHIHFKTNRKED